jgi:hypothetical protein
MLICEDSNNIESLSISLCHRVILSNYLYEAIADMHICIVNDLCIANDFTIQCDLPEILETCQRTSNQQPMTHHAAFSIDISLQSLA